MSLVHNLYKFSLPKQSLQRRNFSFILSKKGIRNAKIHGVGMTEIGKLGKSPSTLMRIALEKALADARLSLRQLDGLVAVPSLAEPHFMEAHYLATQTGLLPHPQVVVRTIDTGGAGPISGLLEAARMIKLEGCDVVAVVAGDAVSSLSTEEFLQRADQTCQDPFKSLKSPVIPNGYDRVAQWQMSTYGLTREQLAMCSVLMSRHACRHPSAMTKKETTLSEVLSSAPIGGVTNLYECARRADGGGALVLCSSHFAMEHGLDGGGVVVLGGGEGSGPLYPPTVIDEDMFSCEEATLKAYEEAQVGVKDIGFFGLYDCFPICLIRAVEAVGLAPVGKGGEYIEEKYHQTNGIPSSQSISTIFPVNTHGGLLAFGAPWETPAIFNVIEAVVQLRGQAGKRQIPGVRRAIVYGNGGIFSASSVAILGGPGLTKSAKN